MYDDDNDNENIEPGETGATTAYGSSLLDRVSKRREERVAEEVIELDIPTWGGELRGKYQVVERSELEKMVKNIRKRQQLAGKVNANGAASSELAADVDFLLRACVGVIAYDSETEESAEVADGFTIDLAEKLGLDTDKARDLVIYLFKGNGIAIGAHAQKLARWMQDTSRPVPDEDPT